jgi:hypothetical protein
MSWTIDQWKKFEENYQQCIKNPNNKIHFNENAIYKTMYLPYNTEQFKSKPNSEFKLKLDNIRNNEINVVGKVNKVRNNKININKKVTLGVRRERKLLKKWQYQYMLKIYKDNCHPDSILIQEISTAVKVPCNKVKNWFQNHRAKLRKIKELEKLDI